MKRDCAVALKPQAESLAARYAGKTVVGVLSGGNLDLRELARTLAGAAD